MNDKQRAAFRIAVALKVCDFFRAALEANGDRYDGRLTPNLTSITDVLVLPFDDLMEQVRRLPQLQPAQVTVDGISERI